MSQTTTAEARRYQLIDDTPARRFQPIDDTPAALSTAAPPPPPTDQAQAARNLLFIALRALSQRTITALTNLFSVYLVALVFAAFWHVLDDPTPYKLGAVGGFAAFCLMTDIVRRRAK